MEIQSTSEGHTWKEKIAALPREIQTRSRARVNDARVAVAGQAARQRDDHEGE